MGSFLSRKIRLKNRTDLEVPVKFLIGTSKSVLFLSRAQKRAHFLPCFFVFVDVFGARAVGFGFAEWVELSQDELLDSGCSGCWSAFAE